MPSPGGALLGPRGVLARVVPGGVATPGSPGSLEAVCELGGVGPDGVSMRRGRTRRGRSSNTGKQGDGEEASEREERRESRSLSNLGVAGRHGVVLPSVATAEGWVALASPLPGVVLFENGGGWSTAPIDGSFGGGQRRLELMDDRLSFWSCCEVGEVCVALKAARSRASLVPRPCPLGGPQKVGSGPADESNLESEGGGKRK
jgi:hypothetical protein